MTADVSIACKYESFNALIKINDPELLLEVLMSQLTPDYSGSLQIEIFERKGAEWHKLSVNGYATIEFDEQRRYILHHKIPPEQTNVWFFQASQNGWYCAYKPQSRKQYAMFISIDSSDYMIDEDYIQMLFGFYCHQLCGLEGTYRDNLTGLYNRKAFDLRMAALTTSNPRLVRRNNFSTPSAFVMLDIDNFKQVNDTHGHLYGDEVLTNIALLMTDSFREYDLLFRYGREEFAAVLMDVDDQTCKQVLNRFRQKVESFEFPHHDHITVSIGYTDFNNSHSVEKLISRADRALYYCKHHGRNCVHRYQTLRKQGLIESKKT